MEIKIIQQTDYKFIEEIIELERNIFTESFYSKEMILEMIQNKDYQILAMIESKVLGYIILHDSFDLYEIMKIGVNSEYRKKGIGEKLIKSFLEIKKVNLLLEVRENNFSARNFYKKLDFKEIGKRKNYYSNGETAIMMMLEIY